jgi:ABC-type branched-subunit amino acid transport system substrate-binding protein
MLWWPPDVSPRPITVQETQSFAQDSVAAWHDEPQSRYVWIAAVVAAVFAVQAARRAAWTEDCRQKGGVVARDVVDTAPVLAPGSRVVYFCAGPDGQIRQWR